MNSKLYIAGGFDRVEQGSTIHRGQGVCGFDGTNVDTLNGGIPNREIEAIAFYEGELYAGGGMNNTTSHIAKYSSTVSVNELDAQTSWTVQPNPVENSCIVSGIEKDAVISIFSSDGKLCKTLKTTGTEAEISLSELKAGIYFIQVGEQQRRLVKK
ncbi:hypothetical protein D3C86_1407190 [compost metagenome]